VKVYETGVMQDAAYLGKSWLADASGLLKWHHTFSGVTTSKEETN
jgi:hypothetical protein